jgi:2-succinyl-5-enolpyruvyl-6-hydroxy-3-cyclohexene-1-carboxylate synthase
VPETTAATFCATLVDEWARAGLTDAVVAPGSRSTPLATSLLADGRLRVHVHHGRRSW